MPLLFSAFLPHSPILIPTIGKDHTQILTQTLAAYEKVRLEIEALTPLTLIILSTHTNITTATFNINLNSQYKTDLKNFGDFTSQQEWRGDPALINQLRYNGRLLYDINLYTDNVLDYGSALPLILLTKNLPQLKIVPINLGPVPLPEAFRFGQFLKNEIYLSNKKVILIATGDLSHRLTKESPNGYSPQAQAFDQQIISAVTKNNLSKLTKLSDKLLQEVGQCGIRPLLILGGVLSKTNITSRVLSYEYPFGIGYLAADFKLS